MLCDNLHLPPPFPTTRVFFDYFTQVALVISIVYHILNFITDSNNPKISILSLTMFNRDVFTTHTNLSILNAYENVLFDNISSYKCFCFSDFWVRFIKCINYLCIPHLIAIIQEFWSAQPISSMFVGFK